MNKWLLVVLLLILAVPSACCKKDSEKKSATTASPTGQLTAPMLRVSGSSGKHLVTLRPRSDGGFDVLDRRGQVAGKVKVQRDRVKFLDKAGKQLAKVKRKQDGLKIYGTGSAEVAKGQWRSGKLRLKDPSGNKFAYLQNSGSTVKGVPIEVKTLGQMMVVKRQDKMVAKINQVMVPAIAAVFGLDPELTLEQRTALVVYLMKIGDH